MKKNQLRGAVTGSVGVALLGLSAVTGVSAANASTVTPQPTETSTATAAPTDTATTSPAPVETTAPAPVETSAPAPTSPSSPAPVETTAPIPVETTAPAPTETAAPAPVETAAPAPEAPTAAPTAAPVVDPVLTFGASSGKPGDTIPVSGTGFLPESVVYIIFDNNIEAARITTDPTGAFNGSFTVPAVYGGDHAVKASAANVLSPVAMFNVIAPPKPGNVLSTSTAVPGATFTISGSGLTPGTVLTIVFHSTPTVLGTTTVQPDGTYSFTGAVPADAPAGAHEVQAVAADGTVLVALPFTVSAATGTTPGTGTTTTAPVTGNTPAGSEGAVATSIELNVGADGEAANGQVVASADGGADNAKAPGRGMKVQTAVAASTGAPQFGWSVLSGAAGLAMLGLGFLGFRRTRES